MGHTFIKLSYILNTGPFKNQAGEIHSTFCRIFFIWNSFRWNPVRMSRGIFYIVTWMVKKVIRVLNLVEFPPFFSFIILYKICGEYLASPSTHRKNELHNYCLFVPHFFKKSSAENCDVSPVVYSYIFTLLVFSAMINIRKILTSIFPWSDKSDVWAGCSGGCSEYLPVVYLKTDIS